jgi:hypothetical protein
MSTRSFPMRWLAPALAAALLAACDGAPDARSDGRRALEQRFVGRLEALRVQADAARNRLWVLHGDGVYVYGVTTRRQIGRIALPIGRIALPDWMFVRDPFNCAPDLALDPSGATIVSSNVRAVLWRLDPERFEVRRHELALDADRDKDVGFTGLAYAEGVLFGVDAIQGSLWKIDLAEAKAQKLVLSSPLRGACGLTRQPNAAPGRPLVLCAAGEKGIRRIEVSPDLRRGSATDRTCP